MPYVAQLNAQRICTSVGRLVDVPPGPLFVEIDSLDQSLLGRHHDGERWGVEPVPTGRVAEVSMAQAVVALSRAGISEADVGAAIEAMDEGQDKTEASIWWRRATSMRRDHPAVAMLAPALGLTDEQVDALFEAAKGV